MIAMSFVFLSAADAENVHLRSASIQAFKNRKNTTACRGVTVGRGGSRSREDDESECGAAGAEARRRLGLSLSVPRSPSIEQ